MEIKFKKFDKKTSLNQQRKLFIECFPETKGTSIISNEHYLWKFHSFPYFPTSYEYQAKNGDDIIGYYAAIPYRYNFFQKQVTVGMVCDVMTGVKARGKGVFTKLGKYSTNHLKEQNLAFTTGYPIRKEVIPGHIKVGWEIPFELPLYIKFLKFDSLLKDKKVRIFTPVLNICLILYNVLLSLLRITLNRKYQVEVYSEKEIDRIEGLDEFLKNWQNEIPISLKKDIDFLKWRLGGPDKTYFINVVKKDNKILGLSISRKIIKDDIPSLGILDYMVLSNNKNVINILHRSLRKTAIENNIDAILCMTSDNIKRKYRFICNGFLKSPYKFFLIVKILDKTINNNQIKNADNWHLMWIDSDDL